MIRSSVGITQDFRPVKVLKLYFGNTTGIAVAYVGDMIKTTDNRTLILYTQTVPSVNNEYRLLSYDTNWRPLAMLSLYFEETGFPTTVLTGF